MASSDFIKKIGPLAHADMLKSGILASIIAAQAILESGYGTTELAQNANNYFGMKCSLSGNTWPTVWDGTSTYTKKTAEQNPDGSIYYVTADFRKYPDIETSIADHSLYLTGAKNGSELRYEGLIGETDPKKAAQIIKSGGYATDISYVDKLCNLIDRYNLTDYDKEDDSMSNSSLVNCTVKSPNHSGARTHKIDRITPHCVVGQLTAEGIGSCFPAGREASCNYGIGKDGRVVLVVDECNRSWCSSSNANDQRAVTIECASDTTAPYAMINAVYEKLVSLCVDICRRNGKTKLLWFGDKNKSLNYEPKSNEMVITVHRWFANKSCPGDWLYSRLGDLANRVTSQLGGSSSSQTSTSGTMYRVRKTWADVKSQVGAFTVLSNAKRKADETGLNVYDASGNCVYSPSGSGSGGGTSFKVRVKISDLYIRKGPGTSYGKNGFCPVGVYTIVETKSANGYTWGRLKSGAGWIALEYTERL